MHERVEGFRLGHDSGGGLVVARAEGVPEANGRTRDVIALQQTPAHRRSAEPTPSWHHYTLPQTGHLLARS